MYSPDASALGLSHALGHKLGAAYSIPHGITSVGTILAYRIIYLRLSQCLTLSPTVKLMAEIGSEVDKQYLAKTLFYLEASSTGSLDGDVQKLSSLIQQYVSISVHLPRVRSADVSQARNRFGA